MRCPGLSRLAVCVIALVALRVVSVAQTAVPTAEQYQAQLQPGASPSTSEDTAAMPPAPPPERVEAIRLSDVEGAVRLSDTTGKLFDQVVQNMAMLPGMRLETGSDGRAELEFPDGTIARVTPNSALDLVAITRDDRGHAHVNLRPAKGLSYYELSPGGDSYSIQVGPISAARSAAHPESSTVPALLRVSLDATPYEAAVLRGAIHFEDAGKDVSYDLQSNQSTKIDPSAATNYDVAQAVTPDTWDSWNADRDATLAQMASNRPANDEPGGPGWSDLDYYGSWYNVPGQGMAWAPDGVDESFDPYGSGSWGYYSGVGYTWASSYPWGWLPYHCGLWNFYNSYGWMWQPANCGWGSGRGFYPYSGTHGRIGYRFPLRPALPRIPRVPASQALIPINRGPSVRFRSVGEPRPSVRPAIIAGESLQPLPVAARPGHTSAAFAGGSRTMQPGAGTSPAVLSPSRPDILAGQRLSSLPAAPRSTPAPRMSAPSTPAPHVSASAPAPAAASHH